MGTPQWSRELGSPAGVPMQRVTERLWRLLGTP
jgi:hypothetical protein